MAGTINTKFSRTSKELMEKELEALVKKNPNFILSSHSGIKTTDLTTYRKETKKSGSKYFVVRNRLCKRVFKKYELDELESATAGSCGITFLGKDPVESTKVVIEFTKKFEAFALKGGVIEGKVIQPSKLKELASLPSKHVLLSMVVSSLQSPIAGFVGVLGGVTRKFVYVLSAVKDKKEKEGK